MMMLVYPFYNFAMIVITLLCWWLLNPIVVLFVDDNGNLPRWLSYFQTFDAPLPKGYKEGLAWLNRNPAYGFDLNVFGIKWTPSDWRVLYDEEDDDRRLFLAIGANGAFSMYYRNKKINKYLKFGWKAWNYYDRNTMTFSRDWEGTNGKIPAC